MQYSGNILMIGCGAVAQCSIPLILQHISLSPQNITIIDPVDTRLFLPEAIRSLIQFETTHLTKNNYAYYLSKYLRAGDICIDLANEVDTYDILTWCQQQGVNYLNTSLNHWPTKEIVSYCQLYKTIQHYAQQHLNGPTAVLTHGANPGLISSFVKQGLLDMAQHACIEQNNSKEPHSMGRNTFSQLAQLLDIKIIHIAEQDTQTIHQVSHEDEFLNAWSTVEFIEECLNHAEFAWGTHEQYVPENAEIKEGNIFFKNPAFTLLANSWIPYQEFIGMIIPHDEAFTIADYLSLKNKNEYLYRPSVLFVYDPCPAAKESLHTLQAHNFVRQREFDALKIGQRGVVQIILISKKRKSNNTRESMR